MAENLLAQLLEALAKGSIRVVDLTQPLNAATPVIQLPAEFGQSRPFRLEEISRYDESGPAWYWNNFSCGEHTGTHFDAPVHWISGRDHPGNSVDTIAPGNFIAPAVVIDASAEVAANEDWLLDVPFLEQWEAQHGAIPAGAWVLLRTDWSLRVNDADAF